MFKGTFNNNWNVLGIRVKSTNKYHGSQFRSLRRGRFYSSRSEHIHPDIYTSTPTTSNYLSMSVSMYYNIQWWKHSLWTMREYLVFLPNKIWKSTCTQNNIFFPFFFLSQITKTNQTGGVVRGYMRANEYSSAGMKKYNFPDGWFKLSFVIFLFCTFLFLYTSIIVVI